MKIPKRVCVYPKDVQRITGRSEKYARRLLHTIRQNLNKQSYQFVTIEEFAKHVGIDIETVKQFIID
jgi:hypothetical protein